MLGWLKLTVSAGAMLKLCQFMDALFVDWLMLVVLPAWTMAAVPLVTTPPVGRANAGPDDRSWHPQNTTIIKNAILFLNTFPLHLIRIMSRPPLHVVCDCRDYWDVQSVTGRNSCGTGPRAQVECSFMTLLQASRRAG